MRWSLGLVAGVIAQVILGALLVKTELDPRFTMGHFLLSMVLLWNAVVLLEKAKHEEAPPPVAGTSTGFKLDMVRVTGAAQKAAELEPDMAKWTPRARPKGGALSDAALTEIVQYKRDGGRLKDATVGEPVAQGAGQSAEDFLLDVAKQCGTEQPRRGATRVAVTWNVSSRSTGR